MDTSETYIKMCEKAVEIQPRDCVGWIGGTHQGGNIYFHTSRNAFPSGFYYLMDEVLEGEDGEQGHRQIKAIWLPRQDQLQEMVDELSAFLLYRFWDFLIDSTGTYPLNAYSSSLFGSMEQLWLAFVMKEKYGKTWNGEDWVNV